MRVLAVIAAVTVLAVPASAGPKPGPVSQKEAKVRKLIELTGGEDLAKQMLEQMMGQFTQMGPNLPAGFAEKFRELAMKDDIVSMYVPIYAKHLEEKDIDAAIKFFSSPAGRALTKKQPAIMQESMVEGQRWGKELAERTMRELDAERAKKTP